MKTQEYLKFKAMMKIRGIDFKWERLNSVRHHSQGDHETLKHFMLKCLTGRILNAAGHSYFTEFQFPNKAEADVYDATDNVVIEFESKKSKKKADLKFLQYKGFARDLFLLYCEDFSDDPAEAERQLRLKLGI